MVQVILYCRLEEKFDDGVDDFCLKFEREIDDMGNGMIYLFQNDEGLEVVVVIVCDWILNCLNCYMCCFMLVILDQFGYCVVLILFIWVIDVGGKLGVLKF